MPEKTVSDTVSAAPETVSDTVSGYTIAITTLGCKVNQADSDRLAETFAAAGCRVVEPDRPADAYVVNTCTVTLVADRKARKLVRAVARPNPSAVVAVCGCYAEGAGRALFEAMPEVDVVRGTSDRELLPEAVLLELRRRRALGLLTPLAATGTPSRRVRAMLKVQDGCSHVCGFCIVPSVRGGLRSRRLDEVLDEARRKLDEGVREVVLCGIRLGTYGWDRTADRPAGDGPSRFLPLAELLTELADLPGLARLRLSSILPLDVGPDLFRQMADLPPVCEHLHLPLQSGDDTVLRRMGRGYTTARFLTLAEQAREAMPEVALATDVLCGYPGETAAQFANTVRVCRAAGFADLHVFPYSPRPGTPAAALPDDVPPAEKQARVAEMLAVRDELRLAYRRRWVGREAEMLVERAARGVIEGLTRHYVRVAAWSDGAVGERVPVRITAADAETCPAEAAEAVA